MDEYKQLLSKMSVKDLKSLVRAYMADVKITMTKKKKHELIEILLDHTELIKGEIATKKIKIDYDGFLTEQEKKEKKQYLKSQHGEFITKEEIKKETKEHEKKVKSHAETDKKKAYSVLYDVSDIKEWKKTTKQEKELVCYYIHKIITEYKDEEMISKLPKHLINYFYKHCAESKKDIKKEVKRETKKEEPNYKIIDNRYNKLSEEEEQLRKKITPEPQEESMSFQEGKKKYKVKSKVELLDLLRNEHSKKLKIWRDENEKYLNRLEQIRIEREELWKSMPQGIGLSSYYINKIQEKSMNLFSIIGKGVLDPYQKKTVEMLNKDIKELSEELEKYYPEKAKEIKK